MQKKGKQVLATVADSLRFTAVEGDWWTTQLAENPPKVATKVRINYADRLSGDKSGRLTNRGKKRRALTATINFFFYIPLSIWDRTRCYTTSAFFTRPTGAQVGVCDKLLARAYTRAQFT